ncbi:hypothetical protein BW14_09780 [Bifidobacterium sp. UTBIF-68]|uniref:hypothetical protein n=1 Tax=Bifidobacterium sp. UTBIF-68 TaxID=1465262 RepID=UPI00112747A0|nr:hypothetical protein [Bifidobacterium sp. UTBIF-68]TPF92181.1 hypothetical protein BW14_09780 [Bifidobacterium sp. UTBIF-68]
MSRGIGKTQRMLLDRARAAPRGSWVIVTEAGAGLDATMTRLTQAARGLERRGLVQRRMLPCMDGHQRVAIRIPQ